MRKKLLILAALSLMTISLTSCGNLRQITNLDEKNPDKEIIKTTESTDSTDISNLSYGEVIDRIENSIDKSEGYHVSVNYGYNIIFSQTGSDELVGASLNSDASGTYSSETAYLERSSLDSMWAVGYEDDKISNSNSVKVYYDNSDPANPHAYENVNDKSWVAWNREYRISKVLELLPYAIEGKFSDTQIFENSAYEIEVTVPFTELDIDKSLFVSTMKSNPDNINVTAIIGVSEDYHIIGVYSELEAVEGDMTIYFSENNMDVNESTYYYKETFDSFGQVESPIIPAEALESMP